MNLTYRYLGYLLIISAFFRFIPIVTGIIYGENISLFLLGLAISLISGIFLIFYFKPKNKETSSFSVHHGLILTALSFIILPLIGAISFLPSLNFNILNAYFESISGFTTTGLTMYSNLDLLPKSLLMWRAESQWLGGIGMVTIFIFIFSRLREYDNLKLSDMQESVQGNLRLYQSQGVTESSEGNLKNSLKNIILIYSFYTLLGIILLFIAGLPIYEAIAMTFTSLSTGGFSVNTNFYDDGLVLFVLSLLMILGATSFMAHSKLLKGKFIDFITHFEKNLMLLAIIGASILSYITFPNLKIVLFQIISAFTTTGYSIISINLVPQLFIFMIMLGMVLGGTFASTSGGIKLFRIHYLLKTIPWSVKKSIYPKDAIIPLNIQGKPIDWEKFFNISTFVSTYFVILVLGTILFMVFGYSFLDSSFQIFSALGTVGLQSVDLTNLNFILKTVLILAMLMGRLEIFPILILFRYLFTTRK